MPCAKASRFHRWARSRTATPPPYRRPDDRTTGRPVIVPLAMQSQPPGNRGQNRPQPLAAQMNHQSPEDRPGRPSHRPAGRHESQAPRPVRPGQPASAEAASFHVLQHQNHLHDQRIRGGMPGGLGREPKI